MPSNSAATQHIVAVDRDVAGARLDKLLADRLPALSRTRIKGLIEAGFVRGAGVTITEPSYRVKPGESFEISVPEAEPAIPLAQEIALDIVFEDDDLIVVNKPAGLVVHPAAGNLDGTLVNALLAHCGDSLSGIGGVRRPGIVHRLDKNTSGLMIAAKNDRTHTALSEAFASRQIERAYHAIVWGRPSPSRGEVEGAIGRHPQNRKKMAVVRRGGKAALTRYRVIRPLGAAAALIECRLATGRTHQIRVHMAHIGFPVVGDTVYGGGLTPARRRILGDRGVAAVGSSGRQALHARLLGFEHPGTGVKLEFEKDFPSDLNDLSKLLEQL